MRDGAPAPPRSLRCTAPRRPPRTPPRTCANAAPRSGRWTRTGGAAEDRLTLLDALEADLARVFATTGPGPAH
ncbi:hypothetical protein AB0432_30965, partial [Streptomyces albidoflavus]